jgi:hypothetical protein
LFFAISDGKNCNRSDIPIRIKARYLTLRPETIERVFTDAVMDPREFIILGGIDIILDKSGFRIRSQDLRGKLPEILMRELDVDPKIVADQLGHSVDMNFNVYTKTAVGLRKKALDAMESAVSGA